MELEFTYDGTAYKYVDGWIYYKVKFGFVHFCPILIDLDKTLSTYTADQCLTILKAIVHGCLAGYSDGKKAKIREFKNVFNLD